MASSARIEELEKKFNENPRRYFAPLANEYRKAGDIDQAIAICRTYVPQQPAHMSGQIVFGQALFEAGQHDEARQVFEAALALDPENLIALRHLGDIARERGEKDAARSWYRRVLDADPRNEEVSELLSSLDSSPASSGASEVSQAWMDINPERTLELPPGLLESASRETVLKDPDARPETAPAAASAPIAFEQMLQPPPPTMAQSGWPMQPPPPGERALSVHSALTEDLPGIERPPEPSASRADAAPVSTIQGFESMEFAPPPRPSAPTATGVEPPSVAVGEGGGAFVTETMAELYLQQGFRDEALSVYRQLLAQNPGDPTLHERVEQLEAGASSSIAAAGVSGAAGDMATQRRAAPSARSIRAFFGDLAAKRVARGWADHGARTDARGEAGPGEAVSPHQASEGAGLAGEPALSASYAPPSAVPEPPDPAHGEPGFHDPYASETFGASALADSTDIDRRSGLTETDDFSGDSLVPRSSSESESVLESFSAVEIARFSGAGEYDLARYDPDRQRDQATPGAEMPPTPVETATRVTGSSETGSSETGSSRIVAGTSTAEISPAALSGGTAAATPVAASDAAGESRSPAVSASGEPGAGAGGVDAPENGARPPATERPIAGNQESAPGGRVGMQTGSVNVLFPQHQIAGSDEAAAHALSGAFGGPSQSAAGAQASGRAARPAVKELSLDSVFRETPPPSAEPRRESSAFSFDQFFGQGSQEQSLPEPQPSEAAGTAETDASQADAEQFSNWLAGLKKK